MPDSTEEPRETLRFAWYGRLSTDELQQPQLAFPSQRAACERRVEVGRIVCEFTDVESGRSHERAGIEALLAEVGTRGGAGTASNGEGQETIDLVVRVGPTRVEVLVRCPQHVEFAPTLPPEPGEASRWGVFLVDRISDGWSVVQTQGQIEAWFEIDLPRQIAA